LNDQNIRVGAQGEMKRI